MSLSPSQCPSHRPSGSVPIPVDRSPSQWPCRWPKIAMSQTKGHVTVLVVLPLAQLPCQRPSGPVIVPMDPVTVQVALIQSQWPYYRPIGPFTVPVGLSPSEWPGHRLNNHVIVTVARSQAQERCNLPSAQATQSQWPCHRPIFPVTVPVVVFPSQLPCHSHSGHFIVHVTLSSYKLPCHRRTGLSQSQ